jgi:hypothetical protein
MTQHWPQAQIFDENAGLGRNTVNACLLSGQLEGAPTTSGKPVDHALAQFDYGRSR